MYKMNHLYKPLKKDETSSSSASTIPRPYLNTNLNNNPNKMMLPNPTSSAGFPNVLSYFTNNTKAFANTDRMEMVRTAMQLSYLLVVVLLTGLAWTSISMIILVGFHLMFAIYYLAMGPSLKQKVKPLEALVPQFTVTGKAINVLGFAHFVILLINYWYCMSISYQDAPPSAIVVSSGKGWSINHNMFGLGGGFKDLYAEPGRHEWSPIALADQGYYYAERYTGKFGTKDALCDDTAFTSQGWVCYSVGVRHFLDEGLDTDTDVYQPLPTPAYNVDVQFAVSDLANSVATCAAVNPIYLQHVTGAGVPIGSFKTFSSMQSSGYNSATLPTQNICPDSDAVIGCAGNQMSTLSDYVTTFRMTCGDSHGGTRVTHDDSDVTYGASYLRIPDESSTVDSSNGGIRHTILIMQYTAHSATDLPNINPPVLRVTLKSHSNPNTFFSPLWNPIIGMTVSTNPFLQQEIGGKDVRTMGGKVGLFEQTYGHNAPIVGLKDVSIPREYRRRNTDQKLTFLNILFLWCLLISAHSLVTSHGNFEKIPNIIGVTFTRVPLLLMGMYMNSWIYVFAQVVRILESFSTLIDRGGFVKTWGEMGLGLVYVLLCGFHLIFYANFMKGNTPQMVQFHPYMQEIQDVGWSQMNVFTLKMTSDRSTFFPQIFIWILFLEPMVGIFTKVFISTYKPMIMPLFGFIFRM